MSRWLVAGAFLFTALVVNPFYACRSQGPATYTFGIAEVRTAVDGAWSLSLPATEAQPARTIALRLAVAAGPTHTSAASPGLVPRAYACGSRTLVASAAACIDSTQVPLTVTLVDGDDTPAKGALDIYGLRFDAGQLALELGGETVSAVLAPDGTASHVRLGELEGGALIRTGS